MGLRCTVLMDHIYAVQLLPRVIMQDFTSFNHNFTRVFLRCVCKSNVSLGLRRDGLADGCVLCAIDMTPERNALMQHVYPQLKEFCRKEYRLEFQVYTNNSSARSS